MNTLLWFKKINNNKQIRAELYKFFLNIFNIKFRKVILHPYFDAVGCWFYSSFWLWNICCITHSNIKESHHKIANKSKNKIPGKTSFSEYFGFF